MYTLGTVRISTIIMAAVTTAIVGLVGCTTVGPQGKIGETNEVNGLASAIRFDDSAYDAYTHNGDGSSMTIIDENGLHRGGVPNGRGAGFIVPFTDQSGELVILTETTQYPDGVIVTSESIVNMRFFLEDQNDTRFDSLSVPVGDRDAVILGFDSDRSATILAYTERALALYVEQGRITEAESNVALAAIEAGQSAVEVLAELGLTLANPVPIP